MANRPDGDPRKLAEHHAREAERLLKGRWISDHVKAQVHASLATYYASVERTRSASHS
jgi:hypothetical protein